MDPVRHSTLHHLHRTLAGRPDAGVRRCVSRFSPRRADDKPGKIDSQQGDDEDHAAHAHHHPRRDMSTGAGKSSDWSRVPLLGIGA